MHANVHFTQGESTKVNHVYITQRTVYMIYPMYLSCCHGVPPTSSIWLPWSNHPTYMSSIFIEHVYTVGLTVIRHCHVAIT